MGESGVGTPQITHPQAGVACEPGNEDRRANVLAALAADGLFLKNFLRKGLRKMFSMRGQNWIEEQADEAFQNLSLRALEKLDGYDPGMPAGPWLTGIALRVLQEANPNRRKGATTVTDLGEQGQRVLDGAPEGNGEEPLEHLMRHENAEKLREMVALLPENDRDVLRLVVLEERATDEVARILNITKDQVHLRKCRALKRLRNHCAENRSPDDSAGQTEQQP